MKQVKITDPIKPWWSGDRRVEKYMPKIAEAISRHVESGTPAWTDIYNRAYEAVYAAIKEAKGEPK